MTNRFFFILGLLFFLLPASAMAQSLSVEDLRFGVHPDKKRLVLDLNKPTDFRSFVLTNPNRLVIDFPEFNWKPQTIDNISGSAVTGIRQGVLEPGISRIVLDLEKQSQIYNAFLLPSKGNLKDRLVIDYGDVRDKANMDKRFGSLSVMQAPTPPKQALAIPKTPTPPKQARASKPIIIIDAGHGGVDPGAIGKGKIYEKIITLGIARRLRDALEATGRYKVIMTRGDDRFIKLYDRVKIARRHEGSLFISIHADSIGRSDVRGASIYTLSNKASDAQTAKLAARENRADLIGGVDLDVEDKEVADILLDLVRRDTQNQSRFFANTMVDSFNKSSIKLLDGPHRHAGFAVLKAPDIPSVLIETGFVSNPSEAKRLTQRDYQEKIAQAITQGVDLYFDRLAKYSE